MQYTKSMTNINNANPDKICLVELLKKNNLQQSGLSNNRTLPYNSINNTKYLL